MDSGRVAGGEVVRSRSTYRRNSAAGGDGAGRARASPESGPEHYEAERGDETASSAMRRWIRDGMERRRRCGGDVQQAGEERQRALLSLGHARPAACILAELRRGTD